MAAPSPEERCVDEQAGLLGYDVAGLGRFLEIALPGRIGCQCRAPALAILGVLIFPDVDLGIDVSRFGHEKRQGIAEVLSLRLPAELLIERELLAEGSRSNTIVTVIVQHPAPLYLPVISLTKPPVPSIRKAVSP